MAKYAQEENLMAFDPGEIVVLKSGGPQMTVKLTDEDGVNCQWFNGQGDLESDSFPEHMLRVWRRPQQAETPIYPD